MFVDLWDLNWNLSFMLGCMRQCVVGVTNPKWSPPIVLLSVVDSYLIMFPLSFVLHRNMTLHTIINKANNSYYILTDKSQWLSNLRRILSYTPMMKCVFVGSIWPLLMKNRKWMFRSFILCCCACLRARRRAIIPLVALMSPCCFCKPVIFLGRYLILASFLWKSNPSCFCGIHEWRAHADSQCCGRKSSISIFVSRKLCMYNNNQCVCVCVGAY